MDIRQHHSEWLSLLDIQGCFLTLEVLEDSLPTGLETVSSQLRQSVREVYEEWLCHNQESGIHQQWIHWVLTEVLGYPDKLLLRGEAIPSDYHHPDFQVDAILTHPQPSQPLLLLKFLPPHQKLEGIVKGEKFSPTTAFMQYLRSKKQRLGLLTNGEQWMLLNVPQQTSCGYISWYSNLWSIEPITLRSFITLLGISRFLREEKTLVRMLDESIFSVAQITDALGNQVKKAIEILIQKIEILSKQEKATYLHNLPQEDIYEGVMSVMLRLIFLLTAEAKGLLPLDNPLYQQNYAITSIPVLLREKADKDGEEILACRRDAWGRIVACFRAVYAGIIHESLRLTRYEGDLFNPDRFPFLEGRHQGSCWEEDSGELLELDNRTLLHVLEGITILRVPRVGGGYESRTVSYKSLDTQQIGQVYESLLDHRVTRASTTMLKLRGGKEGICWVSLEELEEKRHQGEEELIKFLMKLTKRSRQGIVRNLQLKDWTEVEGIRDLPVTPLQVVGRFRFICRYDESLFARIKPFGGLIDWDVFGYPRIIPEGYLYLDSGEMRKETGSHYTPGELTREIVQFCLNPIIYKGCREGKPESEWELIGEEEIKSLKICDPACGSGAFLVQTCRYLGEKLLSIWEREGRVNTLSDEEKQKYLTYAKRLIAERCIYGVDINPLAVEMCKLSLWLETLHKERSFSFVDHAIKVGDSLLGVRVNQLLSWDLEENSSQVVIGGEEIRRLLQEVRELRLEIETNLGLDNREKGYKLSQCQSRLKDLISRCNLLLGSYFLEGKSSRELSDLRKYLLMMSSEGTVDFLEVEEDNPMSSLLREYQQLWQTIGLKSLRIISLFVPFTGSWSFLRCFYGRSLVLTRL